MIIKIIISILFYDYLIINLFNEVGKFYFLYVYVLLWKEENVLSFE